VSDDPFRVYRDAYPFPDPRAADESGLLAYGGDLAPARLVSAYASGIFPWYDKDPILWFSPDPRWVIEPGRLHVGRSLRRAVDRFEGEIRFDTAFDQVIEHCSRVARKDQDGTWITPEMIAAYCELHRMGLAHSVEVWLGDRLVGGLYGVALGAAFFGESMFSLEPDTSKLAMVALDGRLQDWGFGLIDCQVHTDHLERFGAMPWPREVFLRVLEACLAKPGHQASWHLGSTPEGGEEA
jgi:leucyl/phenylalanyl-tRNA--protein transferase